MLFKDLLGPWGLPIVIVTGVGIIAIALLLFVCFLTPGCIGYECFRTPSKIVERERERERERKTPKGRFFYNFRISPRCNLDVTSMEPRWNLDGTSMVEARIYLIA